MGIVYTSLLTLVILFGNKRLDGLTGLCESNYIKYCLLFVSCEIYAKHSTPVLKHLQINKERKRRQNSTWSRFSSLLSRNASEKILAGLGHPCLGIQHWRLEGTIWPCISKSICGSQSCKTEVHPVLYSQDRKKYNLMPRDHTRTWIHRC